MWLLPQSPAVQSFAVQSFAAQNKRAFLEKTLDAEGCANYYGIVDMKTQAASVLADDAWYLSIVAVHPEAQGQGLGRQLLEPTIAEADRCAATCYLETFDRRSVAFYKRLAFAVVARFEEPTTRADCALMVRHPAPRAGEQHLNLTASSRKDYKVW